MDRIRKRKRTVWKSVTNDGTAGAKESHENIGTCTQDQGEREYIILKNKLKTELMDHYKETGLCSTNVQVVVDGEEIHADEIFVKSSMWVMYNMATGRERQNIMPGSSDVTQFTDHLKEDVITGSISTIHELFRKDGHSIRHVFISGDAGQGKTTLCQKIVSTWCKVHANDENVSDPDLQFLKSFDLLFNLPLKNQITSDVVEMIKTDIVRKASHNALKQVLQKESEKCLIIIDGLDEWLSSEHCKNKVPYIDKRKNYTVLMTSRPLKLEVLRLKMCEIVQNRDDNGDTDVYDDMYDDIYDVYDDRDKAVYDSMHDDIYDAMHDDRNDAMHDDRDDDLYDDRDDDLYDQLDEDRDYDDMYDAMFDYRYDDMFDCREDDRNDDMNNDKNYNMYDDMYDDIHYDSDNDIDDDIDDDMYDGMFDDRDYVDSDDFKDDVDSDNDMFDDIDNDDRDDDFHYNNDTDMDHDSCDKINNEMGDDMYVKMYKYLYHDMGDVFYDNRDKYMYDDKDEYMYDDMSGEWDDDGVDMYHDRDDMYNDMYDDEDEDMYDNRDDMYNMYDDEDEYMYDDNTGTCSFL